MSDLDSNITKARGYLERLCGGCVLNRINGEDAAAADGSTFEVISPIDLRPLARVAHGKSVERLCYIASQMLLKRGPKKLLLLSVWILGKR
jgi:hypothetical protein